MAKDEKTNKVNNKEVYWGMPEDKLAEIMKGSTEDIYEALNILSEQLKTEYEGNEMEAEIVKFEQELESKRLRLSFHTL